MWGHRWFRRIEKGPVTLSKEELNEGTKIGERKTRWTKVDGPPKTCGVVPLDDEFLEGVRKEDENYTSDGGTLPKVVGSNRRDVLRFRIEDEQGSF